MTTLNITSRADYDPAQGSLLDELADTADYDRFLRVVEMVAENNAGRVTPNEVRTLVRTFGIDFDAHQYSSFWSRATREGGPLQNTDEWGECNDKPARNSGKPQKVRIWRGVTE